MGFLPEEKKKIYEEEKIRLEAQEKIKKELELKKTKDGCLGCLILAGVIFVLCFFSGTCSDKPSKKPPPTTTKTSSEIILKASTEFNGTQFIITNKDNFDWTDVKLKVNSGLFSDGYTFKAYRIRAGETYTVEVMQFAKGDGTRLNPFQTKVLNIFIWCNTPKGNASWFGSWE